MNNPTIFPADWETNIRAEEQAIQELMGRFENAANEKKPELMADMVSPDAVIVNVAGIRFDGKAAFYAFIKKAMAGDLSNLLIKNEIIDIRFIRPDVAVVSAIQVAASKEGAVLKEHGQGMITSVLVKEAEEWLIVVAQNTMMGVWG